MADSGILQKEGGHDPVASKIRMAEDDNDVGADAENGGNNNVSIEMNELIGSMEKKLNRLPPLSYNEELCCVFKVHERLRRVKESAYVPEMVAIGPYHHDKEELQPMEEHKLQCVKALLSQDNLRGGGGLYQAKLGACVESIWEIVEEARSCYSEPVEPDNTNFVEMMVVDGLFVIAYLLMVQGEHIVNDPKFIVNGYLITIYHDIILLENQLPMCILDRLLHGSLGIQGNKFMTFLAFATFRNLMGLDANIGRNIYDSSIMGRHLLDFVSKAFYHGLHEEVKDSAIDIVARIPSASELIEAGVRLRKREIDHRCQSILDIKFSNGVLQIPHILIEDRTEHFFRNIIAWEQVFNLERANYLTSYAFLMDGLINSPEDVQILHKHGIITGSLGDNKNVSEFFNRLCIEVSGLQKFYYSKQIEELDKYMNQSWPKWRASLMHNYFRNPWTIISVIAGGILLLLTVVATTFASLSYTVHHS